MNNIIQFPKKDKDTIMCRECRIRPATRLCDYEDGIDIPQKEFTTDYEEIIEIDAKDIPKEVEKIQFIISY